MKPAKEEKIQTVEDETLLAFEIIGGTFDERKQLQAQLEMEHSEFRTRQSGDDRSKSESYFLMSSDSGVGRGILHSSEEQIRALARQQGHTYNCPEDLQSSSRPSI